MFLVLFLLHHLIPLITLRKLILLMFLLLSLFPITYDHLSRFHQLQSLLDVSLLVWVRLTLSIALHRGSCINLSLTNSSIWTTFLPHP
ncbi:hypothetical protein C8J55DRAFT_496803 [Lentinula edodes]|uniref:Uncharacterized protein n=1 Tax=Lentinula lateritia TaxID=40482 RepID=A0A9W9B1D9_9AGAR|nr:hypothetical protein C8J55DRAFT_496803 [Lentinula edodes]